MGKQAIIKPGSGISSLRAFFFSTQKEHAMIQPARTFGAMVPLDKIATSGPQAVIDTYREIDADASHYADYDTIELTWAKHSGRSLAVSLLDAESAMKESPDVMQNHVIFDTQQQRSLFEHSLAGHSQVLIPHMAHGDNCPRFLRIEEIARKTGKSLKEAAGFRDFLKKLEATEQVAESFFAMIRRTEDVTVQQKWERHHWRQLWGQVDSLPTIQNDPVELDVSEALQSTSEFTKAATQGFWGLQAQAQRIEERACFGLDSADIPIAHLYWKRKCPTVEDEELVGPELLDEKADDTRIDGDLFKYHPLPNPNQLDWLERQSKWYRALIAFVKRANFTQLGEIAKLAYGNSWEKYEELARKEGLGARDIKLLHYLVNWRDKQANGFPSFELSEGGLRWAFKLNDASIAKVKDFMRDYLPPFTRSQASVFWTYYKNRKQQVTPSLHRPALQVKSRIAEAGTPKKLSWVGRKMIELQKGEIGSPKCWISNLEWKLLWRDYNAKKDDLQSNMGAAGRSETQIQAPTAE
jgi:hypothetical protein